MLIIAIRVRGFLVVGYVYRCPIIVNTNIRSHFYILDCCFIIYYYMANAGG